MTYSDGTTRNVTAIGYNANGQRTTMSDGGTTAWAWNYDSAGRLSNVTDDNGQFVSYGYDTRNNLTAITYPGTAKTVARDFDAAGRMDWVKDWNGNKTTVGYDANSNLTAQTTPTVTAPNTPGPSVVDSFGFDNADRMTSISDQLTGAAQPFATFGYGYDNADQVNTTTTGGTPGVPADNHSYGYTPINQVAVVDNGASGTNGYDKADNPTQLSTGVTQTFDPANQICWSINGSAPNPTCSNRPAGATTYGYDTRGNLTTIAAAGSATSSALGYDQANRLISVAADNAANFTPTAPTRVADTRPGSGKPYAGQTIGNAATLNIQVTGANGDGVPATATAVVLSLTAATSTQVTFLTAYPAGSALPNTSALNVAAAGQVTDNQVTAKIGANGQIAIYNGHGNTDVVVDVMGYYNPVPSGAAGYTPVVPVRVADTRAGSGYQNAGQTLGAAQPTDVVQVTGANNIPAAATAVVVDISAFNDPSSGYLVGYADGATLPATANITYGNNVVVTKEATIPLAADGAFDLTYGGGGTDMTVDIEGYYTGGTGSQYTPISPTRIADTRTSSGYPDAGQTIQAGGNLTVQVAGANGDGAPANATAVILNVTEVNATANSLFTVYPTGATRPTTTTVAFPAGTVAGNEVTVKLGTNGAVNIYNLYGHADAVVDVEGYSSPPPAKPLPPTPTAATGSA
ncbi:MAG TPA: RHS repeat domain-containing protein [Acidimicrobiales bacterium]|nr:RHS repeat domain-containing protein [Acidimicrobiales bacterium]